MLAGTSGDARENWIRIPLGGRVPEHACTWVSRPDSGSGQDRAAAAPEEAGKRTSHGQLFLVVSRQFHDIWPSGNRTPFPDAREAALTTDVSLLVTDLDNTLFDWLTTWQASFSAMVGELQRISGVSLDLLTEQIRDVHQRHGTSEYAFLIEEVAALNERGDDRATLLARYEPAIAAYRAARDASLRLYPGVHETLSCLCAQGVLVLGYTESLAYYSSFRVRKLGLDGLLDVLYSPPDHNLPAGLRRDELRHYPEEHHEFRETRHEHTPRGAHKPNPELLTHIIHSHGGRPEHAVYVGDSLLKDVAMAQQAGVHDVLAGYGRTQHREAYELLRRVTHWTDADVAREKELLKRSPVTPSHTLTNSFSELLDIFRFSPFRSPS